jgi:hypothetical protein
MLVEASKLFSNYYRVWSERAAQLIGKFTIVGRLGDTNLYVQAKLTYTLGSRVRLSKEKLRKDYLLSGISLYVRVSVNGYLTSNAFAC